MRFLLAEENKKEPDYLGEDITLQDKHAVREFADECKVDGLPLMNYKEFSELLNEQGMKPNEELYQVYIDAYNNEEDTDYIEVVKKKFEKMSSNEIIDLLGIPNSSNIDSDSPMFLLPNGSIISVAQAGKLIGQELSDNIHSDMVYVILSAIANKYNYDWDMDDRWYEDKKLDYLTYELDWARMNCGETWTEKRFYCVLPNHMTSAQYRSLEKWLEWGADTGKEEVLVYVGRDEVNQTYGLEETFPEDIIKKIKRYYSSGRLYENRNEMKENMNNKLTPQQAAQAVKELKLKSNPNIDVYIDEYMQGVKVTFEGTLEGGKKVTLWESNILSTQEQIDTLPDMYRKQSEELDRLREVGYKGIRESNELEQRAKKHKKKSKGMGWHMSVNAGDVEKGIEVFNNSTGDLGSGDTGMSMGESIDDKLYYYDGPVYYRGHKIIDVSDIYTTAKSLNIAIRNTLFKAAKGDKELYHYDIVDDMVREVPKNETPKVRPKCQTCGYELNDIGDCPVCDYGEDDLLESLTSLEALWQLSSLD